MSRPSGAASADQLLDHAGWVQALAKRLARDAAEAEDLAQDTLTRALEHPPADGRPLRPWLGSVLGNVWRSRRRSAARRADHEARSAWRTSATHDEALLEQLEQQQALAVLVGKLPEPYRAVVIARYYNGESAAQIAKRKDVPAGSVRSQLARGLALLREDLLREHGSPQRMQGVLLLAAGPHLGWTVSSLLTGIATVKTSTKLTALAAASIVTVGTLAGIALLEDPGVEPNGEGGASPYALAAEDESVVEPDKADDVEVDVVPRTELAEEAEPEPIIEEEEPAIIPAFMLARAVDGDGAPLEGAILRYTNERRGVFGASDPSGPDGLMRVELDEGALMQWGEGMIAIVVSVECPDRALHFLRASPVPEGEADIGDVILAPGGRVSGTVVDGEGRPVAGARVVMTDTELGADPEFARMKGPEESTGWITAEARADGRFLVDFVPVGHNRGWAQKDGSAWGFSDELEVRAGLETPEIVIEVEERAEDILAGHVFDDAGVPVEGASVHHANEWGWISDEVFVKTDESGAFRLRPNQPGVQALVVTADGYGLTSEESIEPGTRDIRITLGKERFMNVIALDEDGNTVAGVSMKAKSSGAAQHLGNWTTKQEEDGHYRVALPETPFIVNIYSDEFEDTSTPGFTPDSAPESHTVKLLKLALVRGRVTADGEPVMNARVDLCTMLEGAQYSFKGFVHSYEAMGSNRVMTNAEGEFELPARKDWDKFMITASKDEYALAAHGPLQVPAEGLDDIEIELLAGGIIEGRVLMPDGKDPNGQLIAASRGDSNVKETRTDELGYYRFERLTPGPWRIEHRKTELALIWSMVQADAAQEYDWNCEATNGAVTRHDIDLRFASAAKITGTLQLDGNPAAGWTASLDIEFRYKTDKPARSIVVDDSGGYQFEAKPGIYDLIFRTPADAPVAIELKKTVTLGEQPFEWSRDVRTATVTGASEAEDRLRFLWASPNWDDKERLVCEAVFDLPAGAYTIAGIPAGNGQLMQSRKDSTGHTGWSASWKFELPTGRTTSIELPD